MKSKLLCLFAVSFLSACAPDRTEAILTLEGDLENGKALYQDNCQGCHGADGLGGSSGHAIVESHEGHGHSHGDGSIVRTMLEGKAGMPSFAELGDQDLADILAHVIALGD